MPQAPSPIDRFAPVRWALPALLLLAGLVLFLKLAPTARPLATPTAMERLP